MSVCTDAFIPAAQAMAKLYGFPGYRFVTMPHPLASLDENQLDKRGPVTIPPRPAAGIIVALAEQIS